MTPTRRLPAPIPAHEVATARALALAAYVAGGGV